MSIKPISAGTPTGFPVGTASVLSAEAVNVNGRLVIPYATTTVQNGYGYMVIVASGSGQPSNTQIKVGQNLSGSASISSFKRRVYVNDLSNKIVFHDDIRLEESTNYDVYMLQENEILQASNVVTVAISTITEAPLLSLPTAISVGSTAATPRVTTNWPDGVLYYVIVPGGTASGLTVDAVKALADDGGALDSGYQNFVTAAGIFTFPENTGLVANTNYDIAYGHYRKTGRAPTLAIYRPAAIYNFTTSA